MLRIRPTATTTADPRAPARVLIGAQLAMLTRLAEIGMQIAEAAGRAAAASPAPSSPDANDQRDPALAYARVARAVRMTIALQSRLLHELADLDRVESLAAAAHANARRERVHRLVERALEAGDHDEDEAEELSSEAWERLADADDADLADRPIAEVVAAICRDLGLPPQETAWAVAHAGAGAALSPFPAPPDLANPPPPLAHPTPAGAASARPGARSRASPLRRYGH